MPRIVLPAVRQACFAVLVALLLTVGAVSEGGERPQPLLAPHFVEFRQAAPTPSLLHLQRVSLDAPHPIEAGFRKMEYLVAVAEAAYTEALVVLQREPRSEHRVLPRPPSASEQFLTDAIHYWAAAYGVSVALMGCIAWAESTYGQDPRAYDGSSGHLTAFQFEEATFAGSPPGRRGVALVDATDWEAAEAAAHYLSIGEVWRWPTARGVLR